MSLSIKTTNKFTIFTTETVTPSTPKKDHLVSPNVTSRPTKTPKPQESKIDLEVIIFKHE